MGLNIPVLLIVFNRTETAQRVFDAVRRAQPRQLFVAADGPREGKPGEAERCRATRQIVEQVDWECEVRTLFQEKNLGVGLGPVTAINWLFENVEEGIILEDDCVPHSTFFQFCEELLAKYRDNQRIMLISGFNLLGEWKSEHQSYHFSHMGHTLGWASWRRAWNHFDLDMMLWEQPGVKTAIKSALRDTLHDKEHVDYWTQIFDLQYGIKDKRFTGWDASWNFALFLNSGLSIVPSANLVSYIGFGEEATSNVPPKSPFIDWVGNLPVHSVSFPLHYQYEATGDRDYDRTAWLKWLNTIEGHRFKRTLVKLLKFSRLDTLALAIQRPLLPLTARQDIRRRKGHAEEMEG